MNKKNNVRPFSMKDKIGYTLGDLGCCFTEQYRAMYLSVFYTLVLQVNPFHVGILMLITKSGMPLTTPLLELLWIHVRHQKVVNLFLGFVSSHFQWLYFAY